MWMRNTLFLLRRPCDTATPPANVIFDTFIVCKWITTELGPYVCEIHKQRKINEQATFHHLM